MNTTASAWLEVSLCDERMICQLSSSGCKFNERREGRETGAERE
jgi:hypothetical protein